MVGVLSTDIAFHVFLTNVSLTRVLSERFLLPPRYRLDDYDRETGQMLARIRTDRLEHPEAPTAAPGRRNEHQCLTPPSTSRASSPTS